VPQVPQTCTAGSAYALGLLDVAAQCGVDRQALLARAGLAAPDWQPLPARLPMAKLIALFEAAVELSGRRDIGLEFGRRVRPGTYNVLGYAMMTCRTLGEAVALVPHYRRLVFDQGYCETRFELGEKLVTLSWHVLPGALPYCASLAESLLSGWYSFGRWMMSTEGHFTEVRFSHPAPADQRPYTEFFACPVHFNASQNAIRFPRALLENPLVQADETLHLAMREQARTAMEKIFHEVDIAHSVHQALLPLMPKCEATLGVVAAALHITARTLQRQLAKDGLRFQDILDQTRRELAQIYLCDRELSALDVALLLGFAEQSSFTRAFKAWFGKTPSEYRRAQPD